MLTRVSDSLQARYLDPALDGLRHHAKERPLFTTFALVFALLSTLPVLLFSFFAVGTVLAVGGAALVGAAVLIGWLVGSAGASFGHACPAPQRLTGALPV